jgi:hypothetical protein
MKQALHILIPVFLYLLLTAESCGGDEQYTARQEQKKLDSSIVSISKEFSSSDVSAFTLLIFGETARMNFQDLLDYLTLLSDTTLAPAFAARAGLMTGELFVSANALLQFGGEKGTGLKKIPVYELIDTKSGVFKCIQVIPPDTVWVNRDLKRISDTLYAGELGYATLGKNLLKMQGTIFPGNGTMEFFAVKRPKCFGKDTLRIWRVMLGENKIDMHAVSE